MKWLNLNLCVQEQSLALLSRALLFHFTRSLTSLCWSLSRLGPRAAWKVLWHCLCVVLTHILDEGVQSVEQRRGPQVLFLQETRDHAVYRWHWRKLLGRKGKHTVVGFFAEHYQNITVDLDCSLWWASPLERERVSLFLWTLKAESLQSCNFAHQQQSDQYSALSFSCWVLRYRRRKWRRMLLNEPRCLQPGYRSALQGSATGCAAVWKASGSPLRSESLSAPPPCVCDFW